MPNNGRAGGGPGVAKIDKLTGSRVFSTPIDTIFESKEIRATIVTVKNENQKITYRCDIYRLNIKTGDFV